ncbi:arrestin domain-containing protein 3-like [Condylostylus longicornis]|uniref:arrestin domain-containing protein 3-like n=1 Tax=Condylostylus longicornis TaxID=2530218 RepID=UPI00244E55E6|nr:arrestin domain-containing protein 3-like [Condylostylus longicornis]
MVKCCLKFDNSLQTYCSGSLITGQVKIILDNATEFQGVLLKIIGKAYVNWSEADPNNSTSNQEIYTSCENYLNSVIYLIGSNKFDETSTIEPGTHIFNFSCKLPSQLPTSFEGSHGYIRYSAHLILDRPKKLNETLITGFTVINILDLNHEFLSLRTPTTVEIEKNFMFWPCTNKPLIIRLTIPQTGYVCGQNVHASIQIVNQSAQKINSVKIYLMKISKFTSDFPLTKTKIEERSIAKNYITAIKNEPEENFKCDLQIPSTSATCLESICKNIQIQYEIRAKATIEGYLSPIAAIPITIGNVPFINATEGLSTMYISTENSEDIKSLEVLIANYGLPPPTYEEAVEMEKVKFNCDEDNCYIQLEYIPKYPVYNFNKHERIVQLQ